MWIIEPFTAEQAQIARQAYRDYGRGSGHAANLNLGDCFAYALAREKRQPLLYKGDAFRHTDLRTIRPRSDGAALRSPRPLP
jgi:ribonuclease VapC